MHCALAAPEQSSVAKSESAAYAVAAFSVVSQSHAVVEPVSEVGAALGGRINTRCIIGSDVFV